MNAKGALIDIQVVVVDYGLSAWAIVKSEHVPGFNPGLLPAGTTCSSGCEEGVNILAALKKDVWPRGR